LSLHAFADAEDYYPEDWGEDEGVGGALIFMAMSMARGQYPVAELIASGALQRHPGMKFVVVECGAGWLAWLLHVLDEQADKKHMWIRPRLEMKPGEFFRRQGLLPSATIRSRCDASTLSARRRCFGAATIPMTRAHLRTARKSSTEPLPASERRKNAKSNWS
jgi:hypothetical protein